MIYFDNAATTSPYPEAIQTYTEVATKLMGNPSSLHSLGVTANRMLEASRKQIADLIGIQANELFFTSGGTEGDNWVLRGVAEEKQTQGKHILVSDIEHPAVKETAQFLAKQGFEVDYLPVDAKGFVNVSALADKLRPDTILVSVMAVNNEVGSIQPLAAIGDLLADYPKVAFHIDAVQALGKLLPEVFMHPRVDFAVFSAHKVHSVRGVGMVYIKSGKRLAPLLTGGGQEGNQRSTTENLAGIAATARALKLVYTDFDQKKQHITAMKAALMAGLASFEGIHIFSGLEDFIPNIVTFGIKGVRGEVVVHAFEKHEIYLSTTSACSSRAGKIAGTLIAMKVKPDVATSAVRISLDAANTMAEIEQFLTILKQVYTQFERVM